MNAVAIKNRLHECEIIIEEGKQTFVQVGLALAEIRDSKLYREQYKTFEQYCKGRWSWGRAYCYQLIDGAAAVKALPEKMSTIVDNQGTARALSEVPESSRVEVLEAATVLAESEESPRVTARHIEEARQTWVPGEPVKVKIDKDADNESSALFHLKQWWKKASKKDKKTFLTWVKAK